ncbi:unnamed protein product [Pleuronectes platessa]|uniref:Uncharacterized protein n=1 Tax=Pleuronectes platessa TaxID=8262 RepID=A0A9N7VU57_PLEPL|nr:unnamed protein product [Pleuronectes platessa]
MHANRCDAPDATCARSDSSLRSGHGKKYGSLKQVELGSAMCHAHMQMTNGTLQRQSVVHVVPPHELCARSLHHSSISGDELSYTYVARHMEPSNLKISWKVAQPHSCTTEHIKEDGKHLQKHTDLWDSLQRHRSHRLKHSDPLGQCGQCPDDCHRFSGDPQVYGDSGGEAYSDVVILDLRLFPDLRILNLNLFSWNKYSTNKEGVRFSLVQDSVSGFEWEIEVVDV